MGVLILETSPHPTKHRVPAVGHVPLAEKHWFNGPLGKLGKEEKENEIKREQKKK